MLKKSLPLLAILAIAIAIISAAVVYENARASTPATSVAAEGVDIASIKTDVESNIAAGKMADAKTQFDALLANAVTDQNTVAVIYDLSEKFRFANNFDTALLGHQFILDYYPEHKDAILAQKSLAATYIWAGDIKNAEIVTDELYEKFFGDPKLGESAFWVADTYYWRNFFEPAKKYYNKVLTEFPDSDAAMSAQRAIATMCMAQGDEAGAQAAIDAYMANYGHMEKFPAEMMLIAGRYGWDKKYEKAFDYYEYIAKYYPESGFGELAGYESSKAKVKMFLDAQDEPNAVAAIDDFIEKYAYDEDIYKITSENADYARVDQALMEVTKQLGWEKKYDSALKYYDFMAENFTDEALASEALLEGDRLRVFRVEDTLNETDTLAAIDDFLIKHAESPRVAEIALEFAKYYDWKNEHEPNEFTQVLLYKVMDEFTDTDIAAQAEIYLSRIVVLDSMASSDTALFDAVDMFIAEYNDVPAVATEHLVFIARQLYDQALKEKYTNGLTEYAEDRFDKMLYVWQRLIDDVPGSPEKGQAEFSSGVILCQELGRIEEGIVHFDKCIEEHANDQERIDTAYFLKAIYMKQLSRITEIDKEQADIEVENCYTAICENYPASRWADNSFVELGRIRFKQQRYEEAAEYFQNAFSRSLNESSRLSTALTTEELGHCLIKLGDSKALEPLYEMALELGRTEDPYRNKLTEKLIELRGGVK